MEYKEAPCIHNADRRLVFPVITWLTKAKFEELVAKRTPIHPFMYSDNDSENQSITNQVFIGKTIQSNTHEGYHYGHDYQLGSSINLEIIGSVVCERLTGKWALHVPHSSSVREIKNDFLVLSIEDPGSFTWTRTKKNILPRYALKACIDRYTNEYFYVGRIDSAHSQCAKPEFFENGRRWRPFVESVPNRFGKVHLSHKLLYIPYDDLELAYDCYDILCLKPSPNSLKILCRLEIRKLLECSSEKIKRINTNQNGRRFVPDSLIKFVDYPPCLRVGEFMLRGEQIIRQDGKFVMKIEQNGNLVIESVLNRSLLSEEEAENQAQTQVTKLMFQDVDSVWLHRFQVALSLGNQKARVIHSFYDTSPEYRMSINDENPAGYKIEEKTS
jgi:hypothetical protein